MASKAVNLLAAVVLYFASVGNVRGFAFTLGQKPYFQEGGRFSGMDPVALGATPLYRGAGRIREPEEGQQKLSLAQRRQQERLAAQQAEAQVETPASSSSDTKGQTNGQ